MSTLDLPMGDRKISELISSGISETSRELNKAIKAIPTVLPDKGETFLSNTLFKAKDFTAAIAGDSTGNATDEWIDLYFASIATSNPDLTVEIPHWNDTTQAYNAPVALQTGVPASTGIVYLDTFTRTGAELYGTTPDIGSPWGRDGSNATGDWTLDGTKLVRSSDATTGTMLADGAAQGDIKVSLDGAISTTNTGSQRLLRVFFNYLSSTNHLYAQLTVTSTGTTSISINKRINNTVTTVVTGGSGVLAANTASVPFTFSVQRVGLNVSMTVNGVSLNGTLLQSDLDAVSTATITGFAPGFLAGDWLDNFKMELLTAAPAKKLTLLNGSMSGSKLDYQQSRLTQLYPISTSIDVLFISSCHNYGANTAEQYLTALESFIKDYRAIHPESGIIISSQNPQKAPASQKAMHLVRNAALRAYAAKYRYGYLPVTEKFLAQTNGGVALIASDGIHPTPGASNSGSSLWRDVVKDYFIKLAA
jgi:hypothetical protein